MSCAIVIQQQDRRFLSDRAVWSFLIIISGQSSIFSSACKAKETMSVQTLRPEPPVE
jgi:hypothetical protein